MNIRLKFEILTFSLENTADKFALATQSLLTDITLHCIICHVFHWMSGGVVYKV